MEALSQGDTSVTVTYQNNDEIGRVARAVADYREQIIETRRLQEEQERSEERATADRQAAMLQLAENFEGSVGGVVGNVDNVARNSRTSSVRMAEVAEDAGRKADSVASAADQAARNVQAVAAASEELSGSVSEISRLVGNSTRVASEAVKDAERTKTPSAPMRQSRVWQSPPSVLVRSLN